MTELDTLRMQSLKDRIELYALTPDKLEFDIRSNTLQPRGSFIPRFEKALKSLTEHAEQGEA